jgi:hypothetical protein
MVEISSPVIEISFRRTIPRLCAVAITWRDAQKRIAAGQSYSNRGSQKAVGTKWKMLTVKLEVRGGN